MIVLLISAWFAVGNLSVLGAHPSVPLDRIISEFRISSPKSTESSVLYSREYCNGCNIAKPSRRERLALLLTKFVENKN